ncbi:type IV pilus twitching motility protein PilT [Candidatus Competibacter phosphatis]|nr:ATPase, T2SS/T4P/T4SS family [Candidatus Competibacter phosphatis]
MTPDRERSMGSGDWPPLPIRLTQADLDACLLAAARHGATDLHVQALRPLIVNQEGWLYPVAERRLELSEAQELASRVLGAHVPATLGRGEDVDGDYSMVADGQRFRFRVNATAIQIDDQTGTHLTFRIHPNLPPPLADLAVPPALQAVLLGVRKGLVLVTGPTGSGKTTLLAATIRRILEDPERHDVVLTVESPIEFLYDEVAIQNSVVAQSQIGRHLPSWPRAVRNGLRRGPTTLLIGESRDNETMAATLEACLTGHLTFTTLHTTGVPATVSRMVRMFPEGQRDTAYADLIEATQLIVSQRLLPGAEGRRVAVREWLALDVNLKTALLDLPPDKTSNTLRTFVHTSGQSFKTDADQLLRDGRITGAVHAEFLRSYAA